MEYISPTNEFPRYIGDIQAEYPDYQDGQTLPDGWREVLPSAKPEIDFDEVLDYGMPIEKNGKLYQNWVVRKLTANELAFKQAPITAKQKLIHLGLNEYEIRALSKGLVF